ncbi:MAG: hypothetical protein R3B13_40610 [Polyangiaceae bacterium]
MNPRYGSIVVLALALPACNRSKPESKGEATTSAVASAAAAPGASTPERPASATDDAVCEVVESKNWGKWVNARTGITPRMLGKNLALGVALGNKPHVVIFDEQGNGRMVQPKPYDGSPLAEDLKDKKSRRDLQRVTPVVEGGVTTAYADYRDKHANGHRRIACELVTERRPVLLFDGEPLLSKEKADAKDKPAAAAAAAPVARSVASMAQGLKGRLKLPRAVAAAPSAAPAPAADPSAAAPAPAPEPAAAKDPKEVHREIRDCRTMVDGDGTVWAVGTELYGVEQPAGTKWTMRTFVAPDAGRGYIMLDSHSLPESPKDPKDLHTLEAAVGVELGNAEHAVFGRYRGSLFGYHLDKTFRLRGARKTYRGGYPGLPRFFAQGGDTRMLVGQKVAEDRWDMRFGPLNLALPRSLEPITLEGPATSAAEPSVAKAGTQRWLSYHRGSRRDGHLELVPVNEALAPMGKVFAATPEGEEVAESHVFGLENGKVLLVYIAQQSGAPTLKSQLLSCTLKT